MKALPAHPKFMGRHILVGDRVLVDAAMHLPNDDGWRTVSEIGIRGLTFDGRAHDDPEIWMSAIGHTSTVIRVCDVRGHEPKPETMTAWVGEHVRKPTLP